ncbi:MAG: dTMP kinase [Clostridiales bacterium]|nr:dTMP kinase [Clostridiales bacterium]
MKPLFITFEGPDRAGKTTQIRLFCEALKEKGVEFITTREPGGCPVSEKIRTIILDKDNAMSPLCEAYLYAASRAEHVAAVIRPALNAGKWVVCDRFIDSSIAYQGFGREMGYETVMEINRLALQDTLPDVTIYLNIDPRDSMARQREEEKDRLESEGNAFFMRTAKGYAEAMRLGGERMVVIDALGTIEEVHSRIMDAFFKKVAL